MPVVRRERHRSTSSSPKLLPSRALSPRYAGRSAQSPRATDMYASPTPSSSALTAPSTTARNHGSNIINNNPSASASSSSSSSPSASPPSIFSSGLHQTHPQQQPQPGMSLRNHSRSNIPAEQPPGPGSSSSSSSSSGGSGSSGRRNRGGLDFLDSNYAASSSTSGKNFVLKKNDELIYSKTFHRKNGTCFALAWWMDHMIILS